MKSVIITLICMKIIFIFSLENKIKMSIDLVKSYERPTVITAFLCWNSSMKLELMKRLGNLKQPPSIQFINMRMNISARASKDLFIITDLICPEVGDFLGEANNTNLFNSPYRWLIFGHHVNGSKIIPSPMENMNILHDSEVIMAQTIAEGQYQIHLIYKIQKIQVWLTEHYGTWTNLSGLQKSNLVITTPKVLRRRDLGGERLSVAFNIDDKSTGTYSTNNTDIKIRNSFHSINKWGYRQILPLFEFLNATRVNSFSNNWGYFVNGSWNGIVGLLARGEADLSGTPIFIAKERFKYISYLTDSIQTSIKFVFREPPLSYQNNLFLLPFNKAVWYSLALFVLIMMAVILVNAQWEVKKLEITGEKCAIVKSYDSKLTLSDIAMIIVGAISQQGSFVELRGSIGRLVMFILFLAFLFLFTAYSASIVALLQSSSKQIRTLSDLLNSRLELGVENTTYNIHYFKAAQDPVRKAIYETKVAPKGSKPNFMSLQDGVRKLQKHPFAFNMDIGNGYKTVERYFYEHEKCGLQEITYIPISKPWLICRKASPYAELFQIGMNRMREHGISDRANRLVYARKPVCSATGGSFDSVSIVDVYPSLLMLLYGTLLACVLLVAEIFCHRWMKTKPVYDHDDVADDIV